MNWICIRTLNKKEKIVSRIVRDELDIETFCPEISRLRKYRSGKRRFTEAMFPCYVFAKLDIQEGLDRVRSMVGVHSVLKLGSSISTISEKFICDLKKNLNPKNILFLSDDSPKLFDVGKIEYGPFEGFVGKIIRTSNAGERVCVLLEFLGQSVSVEVSAAEVSICSSDLELAG